MVKRAAIVLLSFLLFLSLSGFGLAFAINRTVLNPDFAVFRLDRLDVLALAKEVLRDQVPEEVESIVPAEFIDEVLDDVVTGLEPWIGEQARTAVYTGYDYLLGRSENLSLIVHLDQAKEVLRDSVWQTLLRSPPPIIQGLSPALLERYFNEFYDQVSEQIPATIEFDESFINEISPDILPLLAQARRYIGYLQIALWVSIVSTALIVMGIILLDRWVRGATRWLGIPCLISGIVTYVGTFFIKHFTGVLMTQLYLPNQLKDWLSQLLNDSLVPMQIFGIVLMAVGTSLLIISVVYKRHQ